MAEVPPPPPPTRLLKGHRACVNCIDAAATGAPVTLATGSDDQSVRIWDLRADKAVKSIVKCFAGPVEAVRFHPHDACRLFAASGTALYEFDLRGDGVLVAAPAAVNETAAKEDINALAVSPCGQRVAAADDSGTVTLLETARLRAYRPPTLTGAHTNLVNAVAFHPTDRATLVSGGFDCLLCSWDLGRPGAGGGGAPRAVVHAGQVGVSAGAGGNPAINPPFVQCVAYVHTPRRAVGVAIALGDGAFKVVDAADPAAVWAVAADAHGGMATALHCRGAGTGTGSRDHATDVSTAESTGPCWLFSGGTSGVPVSGVDACLVVVR
jgi:WD40 repeat protein